MLNSVEIVLFLGEKELFRDSSPDSLLNIAKIAENIEIPKGKELLSEGQNSDGIYIVVEGEMSLKRGGKEEKVVASPDSIGEWALFDDQQWVYSAVAKVNTELLTIKRDDFYDLLDDQPEIGRGLYVSLSRQVVALRKELENY